MSQKTAFLPPDAPAKGLLAELYSNGSEEMIALRDNGFVILKADKNKSSSLIAQFQSALVSRGFSGRVDRNTDTAKAFPSTFWGIDPVILPFTEVAMDARILIRNTLASHLKISPKSLLSSFDGVMITRSGYSTKPYFDPSRPRVPMNEKDGKAVGPGHIDQHPTRASTADSHQCFLCLCDAGPTTMSTILLTPIEPYTLQGMYDYMKYHFPQHFDTPTNGNGTAAPKQTQEGFVLHPEVQENLIQNGIAKAIKPNLTVGDILIWSSAIPHIGGAVKPARKEKNNPRLGVIAGFFPSDLVSEVAKKKRRKIVGGLRATGQQVHLPHAHMAWPTASRYWRREDWPPEYIKVKDERKRLRDANTYFFDEDPSSDADCEYKRKVRELLG